MGGIVILFYSFKDSLIANLLAFLFPFAVDFLSIWTTSSVVRIVFLPFVLTCRCFLWFYNLNQLIGDYRIFKNMAAGRYNWMKLIRQWRPPAPGGIGYMYMGVEKTHERACTTYDLLGLEFMFINMSKNDGWCKKEDFHTEQCFLFYMKIYWLN